MKRLRALYFLHVSAYTFGLSFLWSGINTIILPAVLLYFVPDALKGTYLGALTFVGLVIAMFVQPLSGAMSDQTTTTWGRRRPWMIAGAIGTFIGLLIIGAAGSYLLLFVGYLFLQIMSNIAHGPSQSLIADLVPKRHHGAAAGVKNLLDMVGFLIGVLVAGYFIDRGQDNVALVAIIVALTCSLLLFLFGVREPRAKIPSAATSLWPHVRATFRHAYRPDYRRHRDYIWLLVGRYLILCGVYSVQAFGQFFVRDVLQVENPARATAHLLVVVGLATAILVYPAGYASDRLGRKTWNVLAAATCSVGIFLLLTVQSMRELLLAGFVMGVGLGSFLSVNWALATDLVPRDEAGKYLGISNLATAGAAATSRLGGPMIDLFNWYQPGLGYQVLFLIAGILTAGGAIILWRKVREPT